jgi:hypothetical protein
MDARTRQEGMLPLKARSLIGPRINSSVLWWFSVIWLGISGVSAHDALAVSERGVRVGEGLPTYSGKSWAVVIGIDRYQAAPRLSYAVADAKALAGVLRGLKFEVTEFYNERATRAALYRELFEQLSDRVAEQDRVLIFFAGHGETKQLRNGKQIGYLLPIDGNPVTLAETGVSMSAIRDLADALPARHVLFLIDACYGGVAGQRFRGIPKMTDSYLREVTRERGRQLITAGGVHQQALEGPEWGHSVFTYYLLQGLEQGLADLNDDGIIPASELYAYLDQRVFSAAVLKGYEQRPELWTMAAERGEFVFMPAGGNVSASKKNSVSTGDETVLRNEAHNFAIEQKRHQTGSTTMNMSSVGTTIDPPRSSEESPLATVRLTDHQSYFPRTVGNQWRYRGELNNGDLSKSTSNNYQNISTIQPMEYFNGELVNVTVETNPGNRGRTVTYYHDDQTGIIVKGWQPSLPIFKEVLPYYAVRFPVEIPSTLSQFQRKNLPSGTDFDGDGKPETIDLAGEYRIAGKETIQVPAGLYTEALRIDFVVTVTAYMTKNGSAMTVMSSGTRWYARNIGMVKEVNQTRTSDASFGHQSRAVGVVEELENFQVASEQNQTGRQY